MDEVSAPAPMPVEEQANEFRDAIKQALNTVNLEIAAQGGQPQVDAVVRGLTMVLAEFVAMAPARNVRRMQLVEIEKNLDRLVALRVSAKPPRVQ